jgi:hypothetical protein
VPNVLDHHKEFIFVLSLILGQKVLRVVPRLNYCMDRIVVQGLASYVVSLDTTPQKADADLLGITASAFPHLCVCSPLNQVCKSKSDNKKN